MKICVAYQHATQQKVADFLKKPLAEYTIETVYIDDSVALPDLVRNRLFSYDLVILTVGGPLIPALMRELKGYLEELPAGNRRPYFLSLTVGVILDSVYYSTYMRREPSDTVLVGRQSDVDRINRMYRILAQGDIPATKVIACRNPIYGDAPPEPIDHDAPIKSICFAVQTDIPRGYSERVYIARRLLEYAQTHPGRKVVLKPKHRPGEQSAHPQQFAYEDILHGLTEGKLPDNLIISYESMRQAIRECDVVLTISSTAVVESLMMGRRSVVLVDFGVSELLGNSYFLESGMLATFDEVLRDEIPRHDPEWLERETDAPTIDQIIRRLEPMIEQCRRGELPLHTVVLTRMEAGTNALSSVLREKALKQVSAIAGQRKAAARPTFLL